MVARSKGAAVSLPDSTSTTSMRVDSNEPERHALRAAGSDHVAAVLDDVEVEAFVQPRPAHDAPALTLVEAPRAELFGGREQPRPRVALEPCALEEAAHQLARDLAAAVGGADEDVHDVGQQWIVDALARFLGRDQEDVAGGPAAGLGDDGNGARERDVG